jgi:hypothetical protein
VDAAEQSTILADEDAPCGKGHDTYQMMDQVSASLTCLRKKKSFLALSMPGGKCNSRPQEIGLIFPTLGRKFDTDLEPDHDQNANRYCCYGRSRAFICTTGVGTIGVEPDLNTSQRLTSFHADRQQPVANLTNFKGRNRDE